MAANFLNSPQATQMSVYWVGLERSTVGRGNLPFRDPANAGRRFIPLHPSTPHRLSPVEILSNPA